MRNKVFFFIALFVSSLMIIPAHNILNRSNDSQKVSPDSYLNNYFNIDSVLSVIGGAGNFLGYSIDQTKVIIGKDGWLFLGNGFNKSITKKISGYNGKFKTEINEAEQSVTSWNKYLHQIGVHNFYIVIGPDKDSIYPEFTPDWYKQNNDSISSNLIRMNPDIYVDTYSSIKEEKLSTKLPLYFKTDTHWNELGASKAFDALAKKSVKAGDFIVWPSEKLEFTSFSCAAGDLARFQRSDTFLNDEDVKIISPPTSEINIIESSYLTGRTLYSGKNIEIESPKEPLIIRSPQALNKTRTLWLRDSFGTGMSRLMARTFSETLQIHHGKVQPSLIKKMIADYKPDYVIVTVVERDSMSKLFKYRAVN